MGTKLSVVNEVTTIANNVVNTWTTIEARGDTRKVRAAGNKLGYSLQTLGNAEKLIELLDYNERDRKRAEVLKDAFTMVAREEIINSLR